MIPQEHPYPKSDESWQMITLTSLPSRGIIWRHVLYSFSECPQQERAPAAHRGNLLINVHFIGCPLFPVSFSHSLTMLLESPPKKLTLKSLFLGLIVGKHKQKDNSLPFTHTHQILKSYWGHKSLPNQLWYYFNLLQETKHWPFRRTICQKSHQLYRKCAV